MTLHIHADVTLPPDREQGERGSRAAATAPLCGTGGRKALRLLQRGTLQHRKRTNDRGVVSGETGASRFKDLVLK